MLTPKEALQRILDVCAPLGAEMVELSAALGRVLCAPLLSERELPPFDNSAMDGYAVRAADIVPEKAMKVAGTIACGRPSPAVLPAGQAMRIMTGAPLPEGADAVIMREEASEEEGTVRFRIAPAEGDHIRRRGEDVSRGQEVLPRGALVGAGEIGLMAALGRTLCEVHRRPLVAIVSTGDELVPADHTLRPGQIVGSNAHALAAQVSEAGGLPWVLPFCPDQRDLLRNAFAQALRADVVLSSGGVSVGEFDYVKEVLAEQRVEEQFWKVAMKPGKPLTFGVAPAGTPVFGLPGNPASSMVSFELFVRPALRRMQGFPQEGLMRPMVSVRLAERVRPDRARVHYMRALVQRSTDGSLVAHPASRQGSGMLRSMVGVNALLQVPAGPDPLPEGALVPAHLLSLV